MKIKNLKINEKAMSKLSACMLVGTLTVSILTSCVSKTDRVSNSDLNRAMVSLGDERFVVDVDEYIRRSEECTILKLKDGTLLNVHPSDLQLYNKQSKVMQQVENSISVIQTDDPSYQVEEDDYDRAFVQIGDSVMVVEILDYSRWSSERITLKLSDETTLEMHTMDLILFSSKSPVMSQVQEAAFNNDYSKTK